MTSSTKNERKIEHELAWIVGFALVLVLIFLGTQQIIKWSTQFDYEGLHFTKTKLDKLVLYHYYYTWTDAQDRTLRYNLYLRNDPRQNTVPVENRPLILETRGVYIALNLSSDLEGCSDSNLAVGDLALFLKHNQFSVTSGITDKALANELNQEHVNCARRPGSEVIEIARGEETIISGDKFCTKITVGPDCDIANAVEKFKIITVADARNRAQGLL